MTHILVVTGSVRPNSVNQKIVPLVVSQLEDKGVEVTVADLKALDLPFFDAPLAPSNPNFAPSDERVLKWTHMIAKADGVILVTPEYNSTMSPVQINAVDWVYKEWKDKPVALIGYGWTSGAAKAHETARRALIDNLKARVLENQTNLFFSKHLSPDGDILDESAVHDMIDVTLDELLKVVNNV